MLYIIAIVVWFVSAHYGGKIGAVKHAEWSGFLLGILLGPIGVVAAGFLDNRKLCPKCGGRLNGSQQFPTEICEHCHVDLTWLDGVPRTPEVARHLGEATRRKIAGGGSWDQAMEQAADLLQGAAQD